MQKLQCEFKFSELDIKKDSGSICKFEKLKLCHSCEIYLTVHEGNHELEFCDRAPNEKNLG